MMRKSVLGAAGLLTLAGSLGFHGCSSEGGQEPSGEHGRAQGGVSAALTLPSGVVINTVSFAVTGGPSGVNRTGTVNVTNSTQLRFRVGDLPVGSGYTMSLTATTQSGVPCAGSAGFAIADSQVSTLVMMLVCGAGTQVEVDNTGDVSAVVEVINQAGQTCPVVTGISSLPLESYVGSALAVEGYATSTTGVSYSWSGSGGTFSAPTAAASNFTCQTAGEHTLTFAIEKPDCPGSSLPVTVTCTALPPATFSSQPSYLVPVASGVEVRPILTVGDSPNNKSDGTPYRLVGLVDGAGAYDNNDGTFTMVVNHEISAPGGIARAHGGAGAFVSSWTIRKADLGVLHGKDLIQSVNVWNPASSSYTTGSNVQMSRFCSADLGPSSAFYDSATSTGFNGALFLNGEEAGTAGRGFAHGLDGVSYELPRLGKFSWENNVASPHAQAKTIVVGIDDTTPGEVYVYVGNKTNSGSPVDRAGLTNGNLYGVKVTGFPAEPQAGGIPSAPFTLHNHGNVENTSGAALQQLDSAAGVTKFNRPEDGAWDPSNPSDFYFVTTNGSTSPSRLWRLRFSDIAQPELGGTLDMLLDGSEGQVMLDNIGIDTRGHIMLQEDPGNNARIAQVFRYDIATDTLTSVAQHNPALFTSGAAGFITQDEEASGIIDASSLLGAGWWLMTDQIHSSLGGELVERGQISALYDPASAL